MSEHFSIIDRETQALKSLKSSIPVLFEDALSRTELNNIALNEIFTPAQDEQLAYWFARFITLRSNLWSVVDTAIIYTGGMHKLGDTIDWRYFVLGYSAVCNIIRLDRFLLNKVAINTVIQRKLNQGFPQHRIERKQYSQIFSQLVLPSNAIRIHQAHRLLKKHYKTISRAVQGSDVNEIFKQLPRQERYLDLSKRHYFMAWLAYRKHSWRRRGASAQQKSVFTVLEYSGRAVSEIVLPRAKKVTPEVLSDLDNILKPGDVFVTRHNRALTNLFLPGFWPHAALYVGSSEQKKTLHVDATNQYIQYWSDSKRTFEALKDGVRFRSLEETLSVDAFVVIRPNLAPDQIKQAIERVIVHAGKGYNFDFDFFRSDQLVCTEIIYRAYDGINGFKIPLEERVGRKTFSAEDLLDLSLDTDWGEPIAIFGVGDSRKKLLTGPDTKPTLIASYR